MPLLTDIVDTLLKIQIKKVHAAGHALSNESDICNASRTGSGRHAEDEATEAGVAEDEVHKLIGDFSLSRYFLFSFVQEKVHFELHTRCATMIMDKVDAVVSLFEQQQKQNMGGNTKKSQNKQKKRNKGEKDKNEFYMQKQEKPKM